MDKKTKLIIYDICKVIAISVICGIAISRFAESFIVLYLATSIALLIITSISPRLGISGLLLCWGVFLGFMQDSEVCVLYGMSISVSKLVGIAVTIGLAVFLLFYLLKSDREWKPLGLAYKIYLTFVLVALFDVFLAQNKGSALILWIRLLSGLLILMVIPLVVKTFEHIKSLILVIVIAGVLSAIMTILYYIIAQTSSDVVNDVYRAGGSTGAPGATAGFLMVASAACLYLYEIEEIAYRRKLWFVSLMTMAAGIIVTVTRANIIGFGLLIMLWGFNLFRIKGNAIALARVIFVVLLFVALGIGLVGKENLKQRTNDVPIVGQTSIEDTGSGSGRMGLWYSQYYAFINDNVVQKIIGNGLGSTHLSANRYSQTVQIFGSHNDYLWLIREMGFVGLFLYMAFIISVLKVASFLVRHKSHKHSSYGFMLFSIIITYSLTQSMFTDTIISTGDRWYFLALIGLGMSIYNRLVYVETDSFDNYIQSKPKKLIA